MGLKILTEEDIDILKKETAELLDEKLDKKIEYISVSQNDIDSCLRKDVVYRVIEVSAAKDWQGNIISYASIIKGILYVTDNEAVLQGGGVMKPTNWTQIFIAEDGIKIRNGEQPSIFDGFTWSNWRIVGNSVDLSNYYTKDETTELIKIKENISNKTDVIDANSTDEQYPTARAVHLMGDYLYQEALEHSYSKAHIDETIGDIESALDEIIALQADKGGDSE